MRLEQLVRRAARSQPQRLAVQDQRRAWTYGELDAAATAMQRRLLAAGVGPGDRVAVVAEKSGEVLAAFQAVLRLGAAYVPLGPDSPAPRVAAVLRDCAPAAVVTGSPEALPAGTGTTVVPLHPDPPSEAEADAPADASGNDDDLAYVLYTSGSTGQPKGVCVSHRNAWAFVDWAVRACAINPDDRLANHAPLTFDLSVLDLYAAFARAASVHLVPPELSYSPARLVRFLVEHQITVWYSVPSALILMADVGGLHEADLSCLRVVLFAGEPYPVRHLRRLREQVPQALLMNLYGPTETNVCTAYTVPAVLAADADRPVPIGAAVSGDRAWAQLPDGRSAVAGQEGELMISGPTVMRGYWGRDPQGPIYATGDSVRVLADGGFEYVGRLDQMVKVRGHRIELGDVESAISAHPAVDRAAVVAVGNSLDKRLVAFLTQHATAGGGGLSLMSLKSWLAERLPPYMSVDEVHCIQDLPRTDNGKVDRRRLQEAAGAR